MVCCRYTIVNSLHKGDDNDNNIYISISLFIYVLTQQRSGQLQRQFNDDEYYDNDDDDDGGKDDNDCSPY
jgi:hypothetical protein